MSKQSVAAVGPTYSTADATELKRFSDLQQHQEGANAPSSHNRTAPLTRILDIAEMIRLQSRSTKIRSGGGTGGPCPQAGIEYRIHIERPKTEDSIVGRTKLWPCP